jgi:radical SAM-linked protein
VRFRFAKRDAMRWLSHLELQSVMERALRRAELPLAFSRGFSPRPKLAFATALPVGLVSEAEWADVELVERLEVSDFAQRLAEELPDGLQLLEAQEVALNAPSLMSSLRESVYEIANSELQGSNCKLEERITGLLAATELWVERKTKHGPKRIDIRPLIHDLTVHPVTPLSEAKSLGSPRHPVTVVLADGSAGKGRPEEVLALLFGDEGQPEIVKKSSGFSEV